jgi:hypothetical protein
MFLNASGDNMFEKSYYDLSFNRSKVEKQMCKLISAQHVNALLGTTFEHVELYKTNVKFDKYNIDIVFKADNKMYILEVDGVYWHGLILQQLGVAKNGETYVNGKMKQIKSDIAIIEAHRYELQSRLDAHIEKSTFLDKLAT